MVADLGYLSRRKLHGMQGVGRLYVVALNSVPGVGHGLRNFANDRLRLLLHCGVT